jgi:hypothetical protein
MNRSDGIEAELRQQCAGPGTRTAIRGKLDGMLALMFCGKGLLLRSRLAGGACGDIIEAGLLTGRRKGS